MYFQKRGYFYSFVYYDSKLRKNFRLSRSDTPSIQNDQEAKDFCDRWNSSSRSPETIIHAKMRWMEEYPEFIELLLIYERSRQEEAKYSWMEHTSCLKYYAFDFFLSIKKEKNLNRWYSHFEDFRDYLKTVSSIKNVGNETLAYSTMNWVIKALNSFLITMHRRNKITILNKCRLFPKSMLNEKSYESVIDSEEKKSIYQALQKINQISAEFFLVSLHTGMRLNEIMGISLADFFHGFPDSEVLRRALHPYDFSVYGFISLESQPELYSDPRKRDGTVPRKPLKSKKRISPANSRTIPIFDLSCFNALVSLWNRQQTLYLQKKHGLDPKNYLLLDGVNTNIYYNHLIQAQKKLGQTKIFTPHDTRHTYSTWLAEQMGGNFMLCKMILGHSSLDITMHYVHIGARIHRNLRTKMQLEQPMAFASKVPTENQKVLIFPEQYGRRFGYKMKVEGEWQNEN